MAATLGAAVGAVNDGRSAARKASRRGDYLRAGSRSRGIGFAAACPEDSGFGPPTTVGAGSCA